MARLRIGCANVNTFGLEALYVALWGLHEQWEFMVEAEYEFMELHQLRWPWNRDAHDPGVVANVGSLHQGCRQEFWLWKVAMHRNPKNAGLAFGLLPFTHHTLRWIQRYERRHGLRPVVIYPNLMPERLRPHGQLLYQPSPELNQFWKVRNHLGLLRAGRESRLRICLDDFHARRPSTDHQPTHWKESYPLYLQDTDELHLALGRTDMDIPESVIPTMGELADLYYHGFREPRTELIARLRWIAATGWRGPIVVEVLASAIATLLRKKGIGRLSRLEMIDAHRRIVQAIRLIFSN